MVCDQEREGLLVCLREEGKRKGSGEGKRGKWHILLLLQGKAPGSQSEYQTRGAPAQATREPVGDPIWHGFSSFVFSSSGEILL